MIGVDDIASDPGRDPERGRASDLSSDKAFAETLDLAGRHVAIVGDYAHGGLSMIHSDNAFGAVTEHRYAAPWAARVLEIYRP